MVVYALYILNKAGGLIFQRDFGRYAEPNLEAPFKKPSGNQYLVLASTFHGLHVIGSNLSPIRGGTGIELLEADTFKLYCYAAPTGTKFFFLLDLTQQNLEELSRIIYDLYVDFVMKNPFYELEQPIRDVQRFETNLDKKIEEINKKG